MKMIEATRTGAAMFLAVIALCATAQQRQEAERMPVYLIASCNNNPTGEVVESSLRESIRSSSGYVLAEKPEPAVWSISLACVNAGSEGEGWTAVAYHYGLLMKATPEKLGLALWNPTLGVFTVGRDHAQSKGHELFAKFDNDMHRQ
jgi:hypothetical protein